MNCPTRNLFNVLLVIKNNIAPIGGVNEKVTDDDHPTDSELFQIFIQNHIRYMRIVRDLNKQKTYGVFHKMRCQCIIMMNPIMIQCVAHNEPIKNKERTFHSFSSFLHRCTFYRFLINFMYTLISNRQYVGTFTWVLKLAHEYNSK